MKLGRNYQCYEITSVMKFPVTTPIRWKNIVNCRLRASSNSTILTLFSGWTTCGSRTQIIALKFHNSYTILWMDHVWVQNTNYCTHGDNDCEGKVSYKSDYKSWSVNPSSIEYVFNFNTSIQK
jgi:hypothetical protein